MEGLCGDIAFAFSLSDQPNPLSIDFQWELDQRPSVPTVLAKTELRSERS